MGSSKLPYAGRRRDHAGVAEFFAAVAQADDIQVFEPREFIEAGTHVTVLGWERSRAIDTGYAFETEVGARVHRHRRKDHQVAGILQHRRALWDVIAGRRRRSV